MPHKSTFREEGCRIKALSGKPYAACLPDQGILAKASRRQEFHNEPNYHGNTGTGHRSRPH